MVKRKNLKLRCGTQIHQLFNKALGNWSKTLRQFFALFYQSWYNVGSFQLFTEKHFSLLEYKWHHSSYTESRKKKESSCLLNDCFVRISSEAFELKIYKRLFSWVFEEFSAGKEIFQIEVLKSADFSIKSQPLKKNSPFWKI